MEYSIVIKATYGNTLRRFDAPVVNGKLNLSFDGLIAKLVSLFDFTHDNELSLTYIDEDEDTVTLAADEDLQDVMKQCLNPLRITVKDKAPRSTYLGKTMVGEVKKHQMMQKLFGCQSEDEEDEEEDVESEHESNRQTDCGTVKEASTSNLKAPNFLAFEAFVSKHTTGLDKKDEGKKIQSPSKSTFSPIKYWEEYASSEDPTYTPSEEDTSEYNSSEDDTTSKFNAEIAAAMEEDTTSEKDVESAAAMEEDTSSSEYTSSEYSDDDNDTWDSLRRKSAEIKSSDSGLDSEFIKDISMVDGTTVQPLAPFSKIWRMRNNGKATWPHTIQLVWVGGRSLSTVTFQEVKIPVAGLTVGEEFDISADFIAPKLPGQYVSYLRLASSTGVEFGQRISVRIEVVDASLQKTQIESNLPHIGSSNGRVSVPETVVKFDDSNVNSAAAMEEDSRSDDSWDSMHNDLQEMGLEDVHTNKMLVTKNN